MLYCNQASCLRCITWVLPLQTLLSLEVLYTPLPQGRNLGHVVEWGQSLGRLSVTVVWRLRVRQGTGCEAVDRGVCVCESILSTVSRGSGQGLIF